MFQIRRNYAKVIMQIKGAVIHMIKHANTHHEGDKEGRQGLFINLLEAVHLFSFLQRLLHNLG